MKTIEINREQFEKDLFTFAEHWVPDRQAKIAAQVEEIWENKQVVFILHQYAMLKQKLQGHARTDFECMVRGDEPYWAEADEMDRGNLDRYANILTELILF